MGCKQITERYHPYAIGILAFVAAYGLKLHQPPEVVDIPTWLSASVTFAAILLGFLATAQSVLASTPRGPNSTLGKVLAIPEYKLWLSSYFHETFVILTIFALYNLAGFFVEKPYSTCEVSIWLGLGVTGILSFYRIYRIATSIVTKPEKDAKDGPDII